MLHKSIYQFCIKHGNFQTVAIIKIFYTPAFLGH